MTSSFVVVAGITGAMIGPTVLKFFRITSTSEKWEWAAHHILLV